VTRIAVALAGLAIGALSLVPPWVEYRSVPVGSGGLINFSPPVAGQPAGVGTLTHLLGSHPVFMPPTPREGWSVRVDYGRLILYYVATTAIVIPFLVWGVVKRAPTIRMDRNVDAS